MACGDQPVLVDAETLLHTGLPQAMTAGADPAADALHASVHRTCLLPHLLIGEHGALDSRDRRSLAVRSQICLAQNQPSTGTTTAARAYQA
ncbi:DUF4135 domain-containing protein, partial [Streptomyces olivaceoviridis]